jgi:hypothetical protein
MPNYPTVIKTEDEQFIFVYHSHHKSPQEHFTNIVDRKTFLNGNGQGYVKEGLNYRGFEENDSDRIAIENAINDIRLQAHTSQ